MKKKQIRLWLMASVVLAIAVAPFLARGDAQKREVRRMNRQTISEMSESQRQRLERNFETYQEMTPAERDEVRNFYRELARDQAEAQGELSSVLDDYQVWLASLQPYQRDQLVNAASVGERISLMKKIVDDQLSRVAGRSMEPGRDQRDRDEPENWSDRFRRKWDEMPTLDKDELAQVMLAIEKKAQYAVDGEQWREIQKLEGIERYVEIIDALRVSGGSRHLWFDRSRTLDEVAEQIDRFTESSEIREFMSDRDNLPGERNHPKGVRFVLMLEKSLKTNLFVEYLQAGQKPSPVELDRFLATLPEDEQDELLSLEATDFYEDLMFRYPRPDLNVSRRDVEDAFHPNWPDDHRGPGSRPGGGPPGRRPGDRENFRDRGPREGFDRDRPRPLPPPDDNPTRRDIEAVD